MVLEPDVDEDPEADGERQETAQHLHHLGIGLRCLERDDEQRDGEAEDDVAEGLDARHIVRGALIGMGSRVLDGATIGELALIGAGALVSEGMEIPPRTLAVGVPAKVKRDLRMDEIARLEQSWRNYVEYKEKYLSPQ